MSLSIAELTTLRDTAQEALLVAMKGSSYGLSTAGTNRSFTRQSIVELKTQLEYWDRRLTQAQSGTGLKVRYGKPLDTRKRIVNL